MLSQGLDTPELRRSLAESLAAAGEADKAAIHYSVLADLEMKGGQEENAAALCRKILQFAAASLALAGTPRRDLHREGPEARSADSIHGTVRSLPRRRTAFRGPRGAVPRQGIWIPPIRMCART